MKTFLTTLSTFLLFVCGNAQALTGSQLISLLQSGDSSRVWQAHVYVEAVLDMEATMLSTYKAISDKNKEKKLSMSMFCPPQGMTTAKVMEMVVPKLQSESATLQQNANILVRRSLISTWPCAENP